MACLCVLIVCLFVRLLLFCLCLCVCWSLLLFGDFVVDGECVVVL